MRAREWVIAGNFRTPAEYGIPEVPTWRICRGDQGVLAFADGEAEPFIAAERPMKVRR